MGMFIGGGGGGGGKKSLVPSPSSPLRATTILKRAQVSVQYLGGHNKLL